MGLPTFGRAAEELLDYIIVNRDTEVRTVMFEAWRAQMMTNEPPTCVKCKHISNPNAVFENEAECKHPVNKSRVTGRLITKSCIAMRTAGQPCGPDGDLFAPLSVPDERTGPAMR